ncbi:cytidine deaminase-like protein [Schizophyllum amplum]|uniref:Cytidine deaminase n=1 Tax=Schizophyllum amplum TaxID=97359 RepID=A0A550C082_9AGAR|nr:cytidine deaminase-like protein [Auriculariopsis ampla]
MSPSDWKLTAEQRSLLIKSAFEAKEGSYSPYSKFPVGAALLAPDGKIVKGANIENASYGGTICAERTAVVKAASEGIRSFIGVSVVTDLTTPASPCGICRQVLREFCALETPVLLVPSDYPQKEQKKGYGEGGVRETTLGELLPDSFGPEHLGKPSPSA